ncbi:hypothetical protein Tco_1418776 [Tanacetum coccineum]
MENCKHGSVPMQDRFQQNPDEVHWTAVKTILNRGLEESKQRTIDMSSTKAEYIVVAEASMEAVWMRKFIDGLGDVMPSNKSPMEILCDNAPAITIANDPGIMKGGRH